MSTSVLFYTRGMKGAGGRIQEVVQDALPVQDVEIYRSIAALSRRLRHPRSNISAVVLLISAVSELIELGSMPSLLQDLKIILVLPDREEETVSWGHRLFPRFVTYVDAELADLGAVLRRMHVGIRGTEPPL